MSIAATLRFSVPDFSVSAKERALFAFAAPKEVVDLNIPLHDARTDRNILNGAAGLDAQGFVVVKHRSALSDGDRWFTGQNIEEIYLPEVCDLVCQVTGAKRAIVNNCAFRTRLADRQKDPKFYVKRGDLRDQQFDKLPKNVPFVSGREEAGSLEPARAMHVDYTAKGLNRTIRECRRDISEMAKEILEAEEAEARGEDVIVPRYAAYSVWRPIKPVKRDPLVVCDYRTIDKDGLSRHTYRALSEQNADGEYIMEYWSVAPPKDKEKRSWYWVPEQQPEEVLILKFADTAAETNLDIARLCAHGSAAIPGTEAEEPRASIECRVLAFW